MAKKPERTQRNMQKAHMIAVALSAQRPPKGKRLFWANLALADHKAHKASVPCVDKGNGGRIVINVPFANSQGTGRGNAPDAREQRRPLGH